MFVIGDMIIIPEENPTKILIDADDYSVDAIDGQASFKGYNPLPDYNAITQVLASTCTKIKATYAIKNSLNNILSIFSHNVC